MSKNDHQEWKLSFSMCEVLQPSLQSSLKPSRNTAHTTVHFRDDDHCFKGKCPSEAKSSVALKESMMTVSDNMKAIRNLNKEDRDDDTAEPSLVHEKHQDVSPSSMERRTQALMRRRRRQVNSTGPMYLSHRIRLHLFREGARAGKCSPPAAEKLVFNPHGVSLKTVHRRPRLKRRAKTFVAPI